MATSLVPPSTALRSVEFLLSLKQGRLLTVDVDGVQPVTYLPTSAQEVSFLLTYVLLREPNFIFVFEMWWCVILW